MNDVLVLLLHVVTTAFKIQGTRMNFNDNFFGWSSKHVIHNHRKSVYKKLILLSDNAHHHAYMACEVFCLFGSKLNALPLVAGSHLANLVLNKPWYKGFEISQCSPYVSRGCHCGCFLSPARTRSLHTKRSFCDEVSSSDQENELLCDR